jgi:hypothetical protein
VDYVENTQRIVIELRRGDGPMIGRFLVEGDAEAARFDGWLELLALLEAARAIPGKRGPPSHEDSQR